jgi:membrane-bound ClpP family serine protease
MVMWIIILALLLIGLVLLIVEMIFIPGTTVVGVLGLIFSVAGIVICYKHFGNEVGFYILMSMVVLTVVALFYSFRSEAWSKFSLKTASDSKVNEGLVAHLQIGDEGETVSTLRPTGKAAFKKYEVEVKSLGDYVETGTPVRILKIDLNQIIVEPIN